MISLIAKLGGRRPASTTEGVKIMEEGGHSPGFPPTDAEEQRIAGLERDYAALQTMYDDLLNHAEASRGRPHKAFHYSHALVCLMLYVIMICAYVPTLSGIVVMALVTLVIPAYAAACAICALRRPFNAWWKNTAKV
jgi:hypothetical protein